MNFQENYASMTDDELLMTAASRGELVAEATLALDSDSHWDKPFFRLHRLGLKNISQALKRGELRRKMPRRKSGPISRTTTSAFPQMRSP